MEIVSFLFSLSDLCGPRSCQMTRVSRDANSQVIQLSIPFSICFSRLQSPPSGSPTEMWASLFATLKDNIYVGTFKLMKYDRPEAEDNSNERESALNLGI